MLEDEVVTQIQPQITTVSNINAKFPYLKKDEYDIWAMKMKNYITNSDLSCWNIETKARTTLLIALLDDHMGDFYHLDDAREIWLLIKARFGKNEESKKMQKSFLKQEFEEFKITEAEGGLEYLSFDDLYNKLKYLEFDIKGHVPKPSSLSSAVFVSTTSTNNDTNRNYSSSYSTSPSYSRNRETSFNHRGVVNDVIHSFLAESEPKQQLAYEDLKQIKKMDLEELD
ncbi:hypothetical protein Tco_1405058 [Tanacetum coccineum]